MFQPQSKLNQDFLDSTLKPVSIYYKILGTHFLHILLHIWAYSMLMLRPLTFMCLMVVWIKSESAPGPATLVRRATPLIRMRQ